MKILDLINEAETDKDKNKRHRMDLDDLEREIRKSPDGMDKDTEAHINKKRKDLAANKAKMKETTEMTAGAVASSMGGGNGFVNGGPGTLTRTGSIKTRKKKSKAKKKT